MKHFGKRIFSLLMVLCILLGLMPAAAAAGADITESVDAGDGVAIGRTVFRDFFDEKSNEDLYYLAFDSFDDFDDYGYFTATDADDDEIALDDSELDDGEFYYSSADVAHADEYHLSTLKFVADDNAEDATLEFNFTLYGAGNDEVEGTLEIEIDSSSGISSNKGDIKYRVVPGQYTNFSAEDFNEYFQKEYTDYDLKYVVFTDSENLNSATGCIYYNYGKSSEKRFTASTLANAFFYYDEGNAIDDDEYPLDNLTFVSSSAFDCPVTLHFTAYYSSSKKATGIVSITPAPYPKMGDINGDGYSDSGDALLALRCAVDDYSITAAQKLVGDVNHDGFVNAGDAVMILRYDAGLLDSLGSLPNTGDSDPVLGEPTFVYTESTSEKDVYADLGSIVVEDYSWDVYINGALQDGKIVVIVGDASVTLGDSAKRPSADSAKEWAYTGEGTVTEVYVDHELKTVTVYETNYYLGQVTHITIVGDNKYISIEELSEGSNLDNHTFHADTFAVNDYVVYTQTVNEDDDNIIGGVFHPETVTAEITRVQIDPDTGTTYLRADGEKYVYAEDDADAQDHMVYDLNSPNEKNHPTLNTEYMLYLDPNGYVLGFKCMKPADCYLYVKDSDEEMGEWTTKVLLDDGTTVIAELDESKYDIQWISEDTRNVSNIDYKIFKYLVNDNGEYELIPIVEEEDADGIDDTTNEDVDEQDSMGIKEGSALAAIKNGKAYITDGVNPIILDKKTVFVDDNAKTTYVGYKEVPNIDDAQVAYVVNGKIVVIAFVLDGEVYDTDATYFMLSSQDRESLKYDSKYYWEYEDAFVNGEKQALIVAYDCIKDNTNETGELITRDVLDVAKLYKVKKTIDEDYITEIEVAEPVCASCPNAIGDEAFWLTTNENETVKYDTDENTVYVYVEYDEEVDEHTISEGNLKDMKDDDVTNVWVVEADDEYARLVYIFATIPASIPEATYFMLSSQDRESLKYDSRLYWEYEDAYINGVKTPVIVSYDYDGVAGNDPVLSVATPYQIKQTVDGDYITEISAISETSDGVTAGSVNAVGEEAFWLSIGENGMVKYDTDENTVYVYAEHDEASGEWTISEGNLKDMKDEDVYSVVVIESTEEMAELVYIFAHIPAAEEVV